MKIFKIAKETKPYKIYKRCARPAEDTGFRVNAVSDKQAVELALMQYSKLRDDRELGCTIIAVLDKEKLGLQEKRQEIYNRLQKEKEENVWWK